MNSQSHILDTKLKIEAAEAGASGHRCSLVIEGNLKLDVPKAIGDRFAAHVGSYVSIRDIMKLLIFV